MQKMATFWHALLPLRRRRPGSSEVQRAISNKRNPKEKWSTFQNFMLGTLTCYGFSFPKLTQLTSVTWLLQQRKNSSTFLTVLDSLIVIAALSGQNRLWTPKYPQVKVYPRGVCTPNLGSIGAPWWPLWVSPKSPWFSVVKLASTIPHLWGRIEGSLWGTHMYPTTPYWCPYETVGVAQAVSRQWWFFEGQMYPQMYPISHGAIFFNFSLKPPKYL